MPRLLVIIGLLVAGTLLFRKFMEASTRDRRTYRPRAGASPGKAQGGSTFMAQRADLRGLRDAFTAEPIDPERALVRCAQCQSMYHADSIVTLRRENAGRCASCQSTAFDDVDVRD